MQRVPQRIGPGVLLALCLVPSPGTAQGVGVIRHPAGPLAQPFRKAPIPDDDFWFTGAAIADIDGDGRPDLLLSALNASSASAGGLFYYRNQGEETFTDRSTTHVVPANSSVSQVLAIDVDGDGDLDVVDYNHLFRNQAGILVREPLPTVPGGVRVVIAGDVDGDGDLDLFLGCAYQGGTTSRQDQLLRNDGNGVFTVVTATHLPVIDQDATDAVFLDADGDGDLDLAVTVGYGGADRNDRLYLNDGTGRFTVAPWSRWPTDFADSSSVAAADVDDDGDIDLVVGRNSDSFGALLRDQLWRNDGGGNFALDPLGLPAITNRTNTLAFADVDGDGDLDLVVGGGDGHYTPLPLRLYRNDGGSFVDATATWLAVPPTVAGTLAVGDLDGDGLPDLAVATGAGQLRQFPMRALVLWNCAGQGFVDLTPSRLPTAFQYQHMLLPTADVDGDGDLDVLMPWGSILNVAGSRPRLLRNDGLGRFTDASATHLPPDGFNVRDAVFADVDGDGDLDLVLATSDVPLLPLVLLENVGGGRFVRASATRMPSLVSRYTALAWGDLDGDGDGDLVVGFDRFQGPPTQWFRNDGSGTFTAVPGGIPGTGGLTTNRLALLDLDGDGDLDLVEGLDTSTARALRNDGTGQFILDTAALLPPGLTIQQMETADLDGDGDLDLAVRTASFAGRLLRNDGNGPLIDATPANLAGLMNGTSWLGTLDHDGDGRVDLLVQRPGVGDALRLVRNHGAWQFQEAATPPLPAVLGGFRNVARADFDGDGDCDLLITSVGRAQQVYSSGLVHLHAPVVARIDRHYLLQAQADPESLGTLQAAFFLTSLGRLATPLPLPGLGSLQVDPALAFIHAGFAPDDTPVAFRLQVMIPNSAECRGLTLWSQALLVHAQGLRLTNAVADEIR